MAYLIKGKQQILNQVLNKLQTSVGITSVAPGSVARALAEAITTEIGDFYSVLDLNTSSGFISTASGRALDLFGDLYNVKRKTLSNLATIEADLGLFYFYTDTPSQYNITIPAGTIVQVDSDEYLGTVFQYATVDTVVLPIGRTRAYASIRPLHAEAVFTAGANTITRHDYISPPGYPTVLCTNPKPIPAQVGYEIDDLYRIRIIKEIRRISSGTLTSLRFTGLAQSGVRDISVLNTPFALGTVQVVVLPESEQATAVAFASTQTALQEVKPVGVRLSVTLPESVNFDLSINAITRADINLTTNEITNMQDRIRFGITRYLNSLVVGSPLIYNQVIQEVYNNAPEVYDVVVNSYSVDDAEVSRINYTPEKNQIIVPNTVRVSVLTGG